MKRIILIFLIVPLLLGCGSVPSLILPAASITIKNSKKVIGGSTNETGIEYSQKDSYKSSKADEIQEFYARQIEQQYFGQESDKYKLEKSQDFFPEENIYSLDAIDQAPKFPGGEVAIMKYLASHINYPPMAAEKNIEGRVVVEFIIDKDGSVSNVRVTSSVDKDLDMEAVRVVKSMPKFTPAYVNGEPVRVTFTMPVTFKLHGTN